MPLDPEDQTRKRSKAMRPLLMLLTLAVLPITTNAQDEIDRGYVDVTIEYRSLFPGNLQIKDTVCKPSRSIDCEKAGIKARSDSCQRNPSLRECKEARALLDSSFCVDGLIFENRVGIGEKIKVSLCPSSAGFGNVSVRDIKNGLIWTNYPLLKNGDTVSYP
jgi:hypothetical protein